MTIREIQKICYNITQKKINIVMGRARSKGSYARYKRDGTREIVLQPWLFDYPAEVQLSDIIHESVHHLSNTILSHGRKFRELEQHWHRQYGLELFSYKKVYARLLRTKDGRIIPRRTHYQHLIPKSMNTTTKIAASENSQVITDTKRLLPAYPMDKPEKYNHYLPVKEKFTRRRKQRERIVL